MVLSIRPEDDGGFFCSAQNPAGTARANFTVRVVESFEESGSAGTSGGLKESTESNNPEEDEMFKVGKSVLRFSVRKRYGGTCFILKIFYYGKEKNRMQFCITRIEKICCKKFQKFKCQYQESQFILARKY